MKRLGKSLSVIIALVILVFSVFSVFGLSYYEGDIKHTVIKGFCNIDWGIDVAGGTKLAVKTATADEIYAVADVVEKRATTFGLVDYQLYVDDATKELVLVVPDNVDSEFSAEEVCALLTTYGNLALRPGNSYTEMIVDSSDSAAFVTPSGSTAETVLIDSTVLESSSWFTYTEEGYDYHYVTAAFNETGTELLYQLTNADTGTYYNQTVSVWLDGRMLSFPTISEPLVDGTISFTSDNMTESKAKLYSAVIGTGKLPAEVTVASVEQVEPVIPGATDIMMFAAIAAAVLIAIVMIIRYRLIGVVSVFAMLGEFSAVVAVITRFIGDGNTFMMNIAGAAGLAVSVLLSVICCVLFGEKTKSELAKGTDVETSVLKSIEKSRKYIFDICMLTAIVGLIGMFMFGTSGMITAIFGATVAAGAYTFSYVAFFGALICLVAGYLLPELMLRSLVGFKAIAKPSAFGGAK